MNLTKLFETQKVLDRKIYDRFPGLKDEPWDWKILALLTELGECANEHREFKKWSEDRESRTKAESICGCVMCEHHSIPNKKNPLLEEYIDCFHFILSIGLEVDCTDYEYESVNVIPDNTKAFNFLFEQALKLRGARKDKPIFHLMLHTFLGFGTKNLGFTWEEIESAYFAKNEINHARQAEGY